MADDHIIRIFVSYSHDDHEHCLALKKALGFVVAPLDVDLWSDHALKPGQYWSPEIEHQLNICDIFIPLLSTNFAGSFECRQELDWIEERHRGGTAHVVPTYLRSLVMGDSFIGKLESLPIARKRVQPVQKWRSADDAWQQVAEYVHALVQRLRKERTTASPAVEDCRELPQGQENTGQSHGYRSTNLNAIPTCAELLLAAGEGSHNAAVWLQPDLRLGCAEVEEGERKLAIKTKAARLSLEAKGAEFVTGQGLGERPEPHRTDTLQVERQAARIFKFTPTGDHEQLDGYIGQQLTFCRIRVENADECRITARITVERGDFEPTLYEISDDTFQPVEVSETRKKLIDMIVEKSFGRQGNAVVLSECVLEPEE